MSMVKIECSALTCKYNDRYYHECAYTQLIEINNIGVCNKFSPLQTEDYTSQSYLKSELLKRRTPVIVQCHRDTTICLVYAETCVECSEFKSWSLSETDIIIKCK